MTVITSTAYSRDLGDELRRLREKHTTLTGAAFAESLGWDPSKVSNIEKGKARASEIDLVQYFMMCGRDTGHFETFRARYRYAFDPYVVQVSDNLRTVAMAEATAVRITSFDGLTMPGLVQTPEYARALFTEGGQVASGDIEKYVQLRVDRQAVMRKQDRPECLFYLHELALRIRVGDVRVMEEQYMRLMFHTHVIRIIPMSAGAAIATRSARMLFSFEKHPPLAYSETDVATIFAHDGKAIAGSREFFKWLEVRALDEGQSRSLLATYVSRLREDPDDRQADLAQEHLQR